MSRYKGVFLAEIYRILYSHSLQVREVLVFLMWRLVISLNVITTDVKM